MKNILLTGCAGFIGSNFIKTITLLPEVKKNYNFHIIDSLTYAGNYNNIKQEIENNSHLKFSQIDIRNTEKINQLFEVEKFNGVIHFAAESHVDNSIDNPNIFIETNINGTLNLLNAAKIAFENNNDFRFLQVSTDEVYGSLTHDEPAFTENSHLNPNSPYSASKTSADLLVRSYYKTFGLPILITRCSNNYGPYQFPEKLIPLMIHNAKQNISLPVYGKGENIRDWIYVDDHNEGVWTVFEKGKTGETYNLGGDNEIRNIDIVKNIISLMDKSEELISFVADRRGHDFRYAMNFDKINNELGWKPKMTFDKGLQKTISWYKSNKNWTSKSTLYNDTHNL